MISAISAALATNRGLGLRAFAISVSGVLLFEVGRVLRGAALDRQLMAGLALAVVVAAVTSLLQARLYWSLLRRSASISRPLSWSSTHATPRRMSTRSTTPDRLPGSPSCRGDYVELSGDWARGNVFVVNRIDSIRTCRY